MKNLCIRMSDELYNAIQDRRFVERADGVGEVIRKAMKYYLEEVGVTIAPENLPKRGRPIKEDSEDA